MESDPTEDALERAKVRIRSVIGAWTPGTTLARMRREFEEMLAGDLSPSCEPVLAAGVACEWISLGPVTSDMVIVYFHGGGYQIGSVASHRDLMARIARASGCRVLGVGYRLAPEHRFPSALDDALAVIDWLRAQGTGAIVCMGDSAGGGLATAAVLVLKERGAALPAGLVLLSPLLDLEATGESYRTRAQVDPMTQRAMVLAMARTYLGRAGDARDPHASPIHGDLSGLPPVLIHVGDHETVLDDSLTFAHRARAAGSSVDLKVWDRMIHHFQVFGDIPEARASVDQIGEWIRAR